MSRSGTVASRRVIINSDAFPKEALALLEERGACMRHVPTTAPVAALIEALAEAPTAAVISRAIPIDAATMDAAAGALRIISKFGAGYDNVDLAAAAARGIVVTRTPGANARSVAELAIGMMLVLSRKLLPLDRSVRAGRWERAGPLGAELTGKCLGIVGCGAVGSDLAAVSRAFGMPLLVYDPYIEARAVPRGAERFDDLERLLERADIVSLHCPLTEETRGMIGEAALQRMKPSALLINCARGPVVEESALVAALREGRIAGAGLDTFATEPPAPESALWPLDNVVVSPHIGASTGEAMVRVAVKAVENALTVIDGGSPDASSLVVPV
jgi:D-3-phosphoglycerate dehydrogenase